MQLWATNWIEIVWENSKEKQNELTQGYKRNLSSKSKITKKGGHSWMALVQA